jgi:signal transduction histidine kinase
MGRAETVAGAHERTRAARRSAEGALNVALLMIGAATVGSGLLLVATAIDGLSLWDTWAAVLICWSYTGAGLVAWWRRPHNRMGPLLVAGGWSFLILEMGASTSSVVVAASLVGATLPLALVLHLLMAFPSGRVHSRPARWIVGITYGLATVLQAPQYLFSDGSRVSDLLTIAPAPGVADLVLHVQSSAGTLTYFVGAAILIRRIRSADAAQRRVVTPLCAVGCATLLVVAAVGFMGGFDIPGASIDTLAGVIQPALLLVLPVTFVLGLLQGGFARAGEVRELAFRIADAAIGPAELRAAIGEALGDRSVALAYWVPSAAHYVDADGAPIELPAGAARRAAVEVIGDGRRVGAIVYDGLLISDVELVRSVAQLTALALDRQRLTAELKSAAEQLRASRQRLAVASDAERRRIARDLHDGAQQRLVLLAIDAQRLGRAADDPHRVRTGATRLREEVEAVLDDLRDLVHRIEPALLTERGLSEATAWLVARMPIPTELQVSRVERRLPSILESTGYFVISEALANVVKHSGASTAAVRLHGEGDRLVIVVRDDGAGGADPSGAGLRGLADRVAAVGGRLSILSDPGEGTTLQADLPLAAPLGARADSRAPAWA